MNLGSTAWGVEPAEERMAFWDAVHLAAADYLCEVAGRPGHFEDLEVRRRVVDGDPATGIVVYAEAHPEVTMIVMSTHGRSGVGRWVLGSVTERVVRHSPVPLLVVRAPHSGPDATRTAAYKTLLVPLDGSRAADQALVEVRRLASLSRVRVVLVTALPPLEDKAYFADAVQPDYIVSARRAEITRITDYIMDTAECLRAEGMRVDIRIEPGRPADVILRGAHEESADAIVMATHGRGGVQRLWLGSVALKVVQNAGLPVLLVRAHRSTREEAPSRREESLSMAGTISR